MIIACMSIWAVHCICLQPNECCFSFPHVLPAWNRIIPLQKPKVVFVPQTQCWDYEMELSHSGGISRCPEHEIFPVHPILDPPLLGAWCDR